MAGRRQEGALDMIDSISAAEEGRRPIKRALVSVYDKTDLLDVARALADAGAEIVSTGSTATRIAEAGLPVTPIEQVTGFPECLDGRVKTLHPKVHAGLLADLRLQSHRAQLADLGIEPFDLLISNLYPFTATVASGATPQACIEQIDIGGPAMVRSSAKNHASVAVITSPEQYPQLLEALAAGGFTLAERQALAAAAFVHTATYDVAVASWMGNVVTDLSNGTGFPRRIGGTWEKVTGLRYGENPHQPAALYRVTGSTRGLANAHQLHGKEMSYNNYVDADSARRAAHDFDEPAVAIIKHANPCGIAIGSDIAAAHRKAHACDPVSAYGGVIAANRPVSVEMARQVAEIFTEVIIAPGYADGALDVLTSKKNLRILVVEAPTRGGAESRRIDGGLLVQLIDAVDADHDKAGNWKLVAGQPASDEALADLEFAWKAARSVKSNAILLARDGASVGVGMGQVNRVDSCRLAVQRAGDRATGSVAASDAFFPFADGPEILLAAGVSAIVQPGGSVRDEDVIAAVQAAGATMYFTGARHFFH
jgi:phosphoribosylaminoimidazolecarboxamide formyltransferase/IMP cyclohydrolase